MTERLLVVGGDAAGMSAASQARRRKNAQELEIVAFERGEHASYSACGIPYLVAGTVARVDSLIARRPDEFRSRQDINVHTATEVVDIDLSARRVTVRDGRGRERVEPFDQLLVGTGAVPIRPPIPGIDSPGVFGVQTLDDGMAIMKALESVAPKRAVVVGGGYIGLEMAEALYERGLQVSLVESAPQPMSVLDPDMGEMVGGAIRDLGIALYTDEPVSGFETRDGWVSAVVTEERSLPADIVVLGLGVRPNVSLVEKAGIRIGSAGGVAVDRMMRTSAEEVWAAGDAVEKFHRVSRQPVTVALGTHANKEGRVAGTNLAGGYAAFPGVLGTAVSKICGVEVGRTGLTEREAEEAGFRFFGVTVESHTRASYYPGACPITVKLVVERGSRRLLGAQIVGREGAAKRIDVLATALWNEMQVDELTNVDISYAPPFSPLWDPVLIAARKAWQTAEES
ncbi:MAG TPA: FAD-dependent oxidoreductase [Actinomycetota bacterium]|nr:FAD-dependent oxidoreductase [Actinomycetota bacterium]